MELMLMPVWNTQLNPGEPEELLLVFPEFLDQEPTELDKLPSETCVEKEECSLLSKPTEDGTEKLTWLKEDTPLLPLLLLQLLTPLFLPEDTELNKSLKSLSLSKTELNHTKKPKMPFNSSKDSEPTKMSKKSLTPNLLEPEKEKWETEDTESEKDPSLFMPMKTPNSSKLSETFPELKSLMFPDSLLNNSLPEVKSEDSLSGLNLPSLP